MALDILYTVVYYFNYYLGPFEIFNSWLEQQKQLKNYFTVFMIDALFVIFNVGNSFSFLKETLLFLFNFIFYSGMFVVFRTYFLSCIKTYNNQQLEYEYKSDFDTESECSELSMELNKEEKNETSNESSYLKTFRFNFSNSKKTDLESIKENTTNI